MLTRTIRGLKLDEATSVVVTHDDKPVQSVRELEDILKAKLLAKDAQQADPDGNNDGSTESKEVTDVTTSSTATPSTSTTTTTSTTAPATASIIKQAMDKAFGLAAWMLQPLRYLNDQEYESLAFRQRETYMYSSIAESTIPLLPFACTTTQSKFVVFSSRDMVYDSDEDDDDEPVEFRLERQEKQLLSEATEAASIALILADVAGLKAEVWFADNEGPDPEWQRELRHGPDGTVLTWCEYDMGPSKPAKIETEPCTEYMKDIYTRRHLELLIVLTDPKNFEYEQ